MTLAHATVEELRKLAEAATPGPWRVEQCEQRDADGAPYDVPCIVSEPSGAPDDGGDLVAQWGMSDADAALIAAMRNALPALLDRLERAEKVSGEARTYMDALATFVAWCDTDAGLALAEYDRLQGAVAAARTSLRAALDDEAPR